MMTRMLPPLRRLPALRLLGAFAMLLPVLSVTAEGREVPPPEMHEKLLEQIRKENADLPLVRLATVTSPLVTHLEVHPGVGSVLTMGGEGAIIGVMPPGKRDEEQAWPTLVEGTILDAILDEGEAGRFLFLATSDGLVRRFEVGKAEPLTVYPEDPMWADAGIRAIALSPDRTRLAVAGDSTCVRLYEVESAREAKPFVLPEDPVVALAFLPDGALLAADTSGAIYRIDPDAPADGSKIASHATAAVGIGVAQNGELLAAYADGTVRRFSPASGELLAETRLEHGEILHVAFAVDAFGADRVALANASGETVLLDGATLDALAKLPGSGQRPTAIAFDEYARFLTLATSGGGVRRWIVRRLVDGERPAAGPASTPPPFDKAAYEGPAARLGMVLAKVQQGYRIERYLLGATRYPRAPGPGDILTHVRDDEEWIALDDLDKDLPHAGFKVEPLKVRYRPGEEADRERRAEIALYPEPEQLAREAEAILEGAPGYRLGIAFTPEGYVHRVEPGSPAAEAGIEPGDWILQLNGASPDQGFFGASKRVGRGEPVRLSLRKGVRIVTVRLTPEPYPQGWTLARKAALYRRAGYAKTAARLQEQALHAAPREANVYLVLDDPILGKEERVRLLSRGIASAEAPLPIVERLVRYYMRIYEPEEALELIRTWQNGEEPDHKLELLRARILADRPERTDPAALQPFLEEAARTRRDREAFYPLQRIYAALERWKESDAIRTRARKIESSTDSELPEHPAL